MNVTASTDANSPETPQQPMVKPSIADALLQLIVHRPGRFILAYGGGAALVAIWLLIASVQSGEWIWASIAGVWLGSIATCVGGLFYLLSNFRRRNSSPRLEATGTR